MHKEILVIDNEPDSVVFNNELKAAGYHTVLAKNGAEALVALWEKEDIGLVLLDVRLPVIDGLDIFEIIQKHFPDKKVIINSVIQKDQRRFLIYDHDKDSQSTKDFSSLKEKIDNALKNKKEALANSDKRNSQRMQVTVIATCEKDKAQAGGAYVYFHSCSKDLSSTGGRFVIDEDIKVGQHFRIALELPVYAVPLLIECEVVWARKLEGLKSGNKEGIEVGARFVKLDSPHDEEKLKEYLKNIK